MGGARGGAGLESPPSPQQEVGAGHLFTEASQASCHSLVYVLIRSRQPLVLQKGGVSMAVILYYFVLEIPSFLSFFF